MRGNMLEVSNDLGNFELCMEASDFYDHLEALNAQFVTNAMPEDAAARRREFLERLKKYGAEVGDELDPDTGETLTYFVISEQVKINYFAKRLDELKKIIADMDIEVFAGVAEGADHASLSYAESLISNEYSDMVYFNQAAYSVDSFIRNATGGKYYIGDSVVFLH